MPVAAARPIVLTACERHRLKKATHGHKTEHQTRVRGQIVLHAALGCSNARIVRDTGLHIDTVRTWRGRFAEEGLLGLADRKRSGAPCPLHPRAGRRGQGTSLSAARRHRRTALTLVVPGTGRRADRTRHHRHLSASTVRRWLRQDALKPWQYRSWIFPRDPDFRAKAQRVLDLYARTVDGEPLDHDEYVVSADEKTSIQARCRCHPTVAPGQARVMRVNHEYQRGGALAYLAAYDVHRARAVGRCEPKTGIVPFMNLVTQVMTTEPYASAKRVFWIVDNGSSHRGQRAIDRLTTAFPNAVMVHTPVHASWTNQIEIFFSIVQRKVVSPSDFTDLNQVRDRLRAFEDRCNATAQPFQWRFTTADLDDLLARLDRRTADHQEESSTALAA